MIKGANMFILSVVLYILFLGSLNVSLTLKPAPGIGTFSCDKSTWFCKQDKNSTQTLEECSLTCKDPSSKSSSLLQRPVLAAYYAFYQDPYCSGSCNQTPCAKSLLSEPEILNSKLDLIIINPIAPATAGGVTLSYINQIYTGTKSESNTFYPPPPAIKQGIADLHKNGKKVTLSFIPGSANDMWGSGDAWFAKFKSACQKIMTEWDIDGFDWDCEVGGCPPSSCGGQWPENSCKVWALNFFKTLKQLKPNPGRGNSDNTAIVTWTGELTWQLASLQSAEPYLPYVDYFLTMNENYSVFDPKQLYQMALQFSKDKKWPISRIVLGVKAGGCMPGSNGDGANIEQIQKLITTRVKDTQTLTDICGGWSLWNISRDYGCKYGRTQTLVNGSNTCYTCNSGDCPIGIGSFTAGRWNFLNLFNFIKN